MEQLALSVGVSWQTVQQWENGKTAPKRLRLDAVATALQTTADNLLFGVSQSAAQEANEGLKDLIAFRSATFKVSPGSRSVEVACDSQNEDILCCVPYSWAVARNLNLGKLYAMRVSGHHMAPSVMDRDVILIDTTDTKLLKNTVFALSRGGEIAIRRVQYESQHWWIKSDNPDQSTYTPERYGRDMVLIGKVVYLHRDL